MKKIKIQFSPVSFTPEINSKEINPNSPNFENSEIAKLVNISQAEKEFNRQFEEWRGDSDGSVGLD